MHKYKVLEEIDNGSYSVVYRGEDLTDNSTVAIKRMKKPLAQSQKLQLRELKILELIRHPCLTCLKEWIVEDDGILNFVFEHMPENLLSLYTRLARKRKKNLSEKEIKCVLLQCLLGLHYLHEQGIIHRDVKPENVLIDKHSKLVKVTDFGLSKQLTPLHPMTAYVSTRWYRAPEMLLKADYSTPADIFALGCIVAELLLSKELFDGADTFDQIHKILQVLGTPSPGAWPEFPLLLEQLGLELPCYEPIEFEQLFPNASPQMVHLLHQMLQLNPAHRARAKDLIFSPFFEDVLSELPSEVREHYHSLMEAEPRRTKHSVTGLERPKLLQMSSLERVKPKPYTYVNPGRGNNELNRSLMKTQNYFGGIYSGYMPKGRTQLRSKEPRDNSYRKGNREGFASESPSRHHYKGYNPYQQYRRHK